MGNQGEKSDTKKQWTAYNFRTQFHSHACTCLISLSIQNAEDMEQKLRCLECSSCEAKKILHLHIRTASYHLEWATTGQKSNEEEESFVRGGPKTTIFKDSCTSNTPTNKWTYWKKKIKISVNQWKNLCSIFSLLVHHYRQQYRTPFCYHVYWNLKEVYQSSTEAGHYCFSSNFLGQTVCNSTSSHLSRQACREKASVLSIDARKCPSYSPNNTAWYNSPNTFSKSAMSPQHKLSICSVAHGVVVIFFVNRQEVISIA